jgi:hypothetical protein
MTHSPEAQFACNRTEELKLNTALHTPWQQTGNAFPVCASGGQRNSNINEI